MLTAPTAPQATRVRERVPTRVFPDAADASRAVAQEIAALIRRRQSEGRPCVLGLATGSTPQGVYDELVRLHRAEGLSFAGVETFNLDEYYPMAPQTLQSYRRFMREHLFDHVDIDPARTHLPDGLAAESDVHAHCRAYEAAIQAAGGIDLQLLGIGRTGHVGFNEPGSARDSRTRLITLDRTTRVDAASDFFGEAHVPRRAITMGVGTILDARRVIMMAFGEKKSRVVARAIEDPPTAAVAASFLQEHPNATVVLDAAAAADLTRVRCPWVLAPIDWDELTIRRAVIWLATQVDKAILKLTDEDYNEHHLQDLLATHGHAYDINLWVFRALQKTITGWPGGKAGIDPFPKRVLVFSPHPDDDVISMGGTLIRLAHQGHEVHVAYQTSGNIAVSADDAARYLDFVVDFNRRLGVDSERIPALERRIDDALRTTAPGEVDTPEVQLVKGLIRRGEARAAGRFCGLPESRLHFLDLPFYETGVVRKNPLTAADVAIIVKLLDEVAPHQIYAAGDLSDPHGTHRTCLRAIELALAETADRSWRASCAIWLYRGAWQEWEPERIEMAVPLSPQELERKRHAIFRHQSQKDKALFPGDDDREFWQRAESRNRATARRYDELGLAEYEAIEAFVQWRDPNRTGG